MHGQNVDRAPVRMKKHLSIVCSPRYQALSFTYVRVKQTVSDNLHFFHFAMMRFCAAVGRGGAFEDC